MTAPALRTLEIETHRCARMICKGVHDMVKKLHAHCAP